MMVVVDNVVTAFGSHVVHNGVSLHVNKGEIFGLLGGSGSGKTVLMREMILLNQPRSGRIEVLGCSLATLDEAAKQALRLQWGVLFQFGALFSSLTVLENVMIPLQEYTALPRGFIEEMARMKLKMVGLPEHAASLWPSELSGGMKKRAGLARALALDPKLLFLDEPTSGLDPASARGFDTLILELRELLGITIVMVTHDKDTIRDVLDRFVILGEGKVQAQGSYTELMGTHSELMKRFME
ncbi:ATP-binding cassette domain-containing protein [Sulfurospirillum sp. T05]|uniref:ATP-binding cassette domain-containing protein n=1 Tax=Sulfurospirillum tamanense TaxID=2813362 RepID=A0ABS2WTC7_9BACT|nr:ATP-binding cassette domain-containing protein [Sulfurospirillum tamanensis]MBN2964908.1 ATP-binding cassette domain-containing protein [Sulfurospirillum tamanensis]